MMLEYPERYNMIGKMAHGTEHMTPEERVDILMTPFKGLGTFRSM